MSYIIPPQGPPNWTFLSNHAHVLICLAHREGLTMRDIAAEVGITERAVQRIVADLEEAGAITRVKQGRQNRYEINASLPLRHALESHRTIGNLLDLIANE